MQNKGNAIAHAARSPWTTRRITTWRAAATVEVSPCVFLDGEVYERLTHMAKQARAHEAQFLEHLILWAEAIYNYQPPLSPPTASLVEAVEQGGAPAGAAGHRGRPAQRCLTIRTFTNCR